MACQCIRSRMPIRTRGEVLVGFGSTRASSFCRDFRRYSLTARKQPSTGQSIEPRRVCRRPLDLSHATISVMLAEA